MTSVARLVGVYDADGGLRGELAYIVGKVAGRHCELCDITHSPVRRRRAWDEYVATLPVPFDVVHRNERTPAIAAATAGHEPCVAAELSDGSVEVVLDRHDLRRAGDVAGLARALSTALAERHLLLTAG